MHRAVKGVASKYTDAETASNIAMGAELGVGILSGGLASAGRAVTKGLANGHTLGALSKQALHHASRQMGVEVAGAAIGGTAGYHVTGDMSGIFLYASLGQAASGALGAKYIKCFVDDTPVWIPLDDEPQTVIAAAGLTQERRAVESSLNWRTYVSIGIAAGIAVAYGSVLKRKLEDEFEDPIASLDHALASVFDWTPKVDVDEPQYWDDERPRLATR